METIHDLAVIGGGINGCGIARDAAGRGLSVHLCEMNDLASGTSSMSTKLVHGGLRYLEHYEFRLVREALIEREVLWRAAPHLIEPLRFVLPHRAGGRPAWLLRLGLFVYDHLGGRALLPGTETLDLTRDPAGAVLKPGLFRRGFEYSDCRVDDARLVVLTARDAADRGAVIAPRTRAVAARRADDGWTLTLEARDGRRSTIRARVLVDAAGPWVARVLDDVVEDPAPDRVRVRLVQGSHVVVPRLWDHDRAYLFQNDDGRVVFAIPWERDFTMIGTTDLDYRGDPGEARASPAEIDYLRRAASDHFARPIRAEDVVWSWSGVRPLKDDGATAAQEASRDYVLDLDRRVEGAPLLSVIGGKLTTYRRLAEAVLAKLAPVLPAIGPAWTATAPLPGGEFPHDGRARLVATLRARHPFLEAAEADRLVRAYGTIAATILGDARRREDLGRDFGGGLSEAEVRHLMTREWAVEADDVLWRRSKLGLRLTPRQGAALAAFMAEATSAATV